MDMQSSHVMVVSTVHVYTGTKFDKTVKFNKALPGDHPYKYGPFTQHFRDCLHLHVLM